MFDIFDDGKEFFNTSNEREFINRVFHGCKNISIDYGIMEKSDNVYVYPADFGWSDLGTWSSLYDNLKLDKNKNAVQGDKVMLYDSLENIIKVPNDKLVVIQGLDGFIVVENDGVLLICKKDNEQKIKNFVSDLKKDIH
jgi:mannose-1-phosphate guanylyltransferase